MKPLYHCAVCGRLSTKCGSYRPIGDKMVCITDCAKAPTLPNGED